MKYYYDLHIHSCLTENAAEDMTPSNIVLAAKVLSLDVIAIADHNAIDNIKPAVFLARENNIMLLPAVEITTAEEVHLVCYFAKYDDLLAFWAEVSPFYPKTFETLNIFGRQIIVDKNDREIGENKSLLYVANSLSVEEIVEMADKFGGTTVPSHIDKDANSILTTLGFCAVDMGFQFFEFSAKANDMDIYKKYPLLKRKKIIRNSNSAQINEISPCLNYFDINKDKSEITTSDFIRYLKGELNE